MSNARNDFPKNASFQKQKEYVDKLPIGQRENLEKVLNVIRAKESPFTISSEEIKAIDPKVNVQLYHHSMGAPASSEPDEDSDCEDGVELTTAAVTRVLNISGKKKNEKITINIPDNNSTQASTISLKFDADGTFKKAYQKKTSMAELKAGLFKDNQARAGIVVDANDAKGHMFTTFTRSKP